MKSQNKPFQSVHAVDIPLEINLQECLRPFLQKVVEGNDKN